MDITSRVVTDMKRRTSLLPKDVENWFTAASVDSSLMSLHRTQILAIRTMMQTLLKRQPPLVDKLSAAQSPGDFAHAYNDLTVEVIGTNGLWNLFRMILNQEKDVALGPILKSAHLISADCYLTCMRKAAALGIVSQDQFREPPLVYLDAMDSPVTLSRGTQTKFVNSLLLLGKQLLPIPVIRMPVDHLSCMWLLCTIHHEVGHDIDQDLELENELNALLIAALKQQPAAPALNDRITLWQHWTREILGDTFGILLGGAGYAFTMATLLMPLAPLFDAPQKNKPHPDSYLRINLLAAMLKKLGVPDLTSAADFMLHKWYDPQPNKPAWILPFIDDCDKVAETFLNAPLQALAKDGTAHTLRDLAPDPAGDAAKVAKLANFLLNETGFPNPQAEGITWRLVPVAAQLAYTNFDGTQAGGLDGIQLRALQYLEAIPRPAFLAPIPNRTQQIAKLAEQIDFSVLFEEGGEDEDG